MTRAAAAHHRASALDAASAGAPVASFHATGSVEVRAVRVLLPLLARAARPRCARCGGIAVLGPMENIAVEYRYDLLGRAVPVSHHCAPARHVDATLCAPCLRAAEHRHPGRVLGAVLVVTALRILYIALSPSPHGPVTAAALCALSTLSFIRVMRPSLVARICGRTRTVVYVRDDAAADTGVGDDGPSLATVRLALSGYSAAALCGAVPSLTGAHTETGRAPALTDS